MTLHPAAMDDQRLHLHLAVATDANSSLSSGLVQLAWVAESGGAPWVKVLWQQAPSSAFPDPLFDLTPFCPSLNLVENLAFR